MEYTKLGDTDIEVSKICLGTMTFGQQNTEKEGHEQLDYASDRGINFIDTAEMYPVPAKKETYGHTEKIIGTWLARQKRDDYVIATKMIGPKPGMEYIRGGSDYTPDQIRQAVEDSLKRLQTDYIDLFQLHWPERTTNYFSQLGFTYDPEERWNNSFYDILSTFDQLIKEGKVRFVGVSNETPYGVMNYLRVAEKYSLPRIVSIQNPYSLINRTFEVGLAEIAVRENVGLMAYSPLGAGMLSGKYLQQHSPENARLNLFPEMQRFTKPEAKQATAEYVELAHSYGLSPVQMALAFVNSREFLTSNIIGATTMDQLKENIDSININLPGELVDRINEIHKAQPNPAP